MWYSFESGLHYYVLAEQAQVNHQHLTKYCSFSIFLWLQLHKIYQAIPLWLKLLKYNHFCLEKNIDHSIFMCLTSHIVRNIMRLKPRMLGDWSYIPWLTMATEYLNFQNASSIDHTCAMVFSICIIRSAISSTSWWFQDVIQWTINALSHKTSNSSWNSVYDLSTSPLVLQND